MYDVNTSKEKLEQLITQQHMTLCAVSVKASYWKDFIKYALFTVGTIWSYNMNTHTCTHTLCIYIYTKIRLLHLRMLQHELLLPKNHTSSSSQRVSLWKCIQLFLKAEFPSIKFLFNQRVQNCQYHKTHYLMYIICMYTTCT